MSKTIVIVTATRAEYGLLKSIIGKLKSIEGLKVRIIATGAHLSPEFGLTYREIENDGFVIDKKIEILLSSDTPVSVSKSTGLAIIGFSEYFNENKSDALLVLGDRYETLGVCIAAMNERIPIIHLYGGETTEGAIDEAIRHSITKMSYWHFTSTEQYRKRVIQLGENPKRVYNVGSLGVENVLNQILLSKQALESELKLQLNMPYAVVTYHPVTLEDKNICETVKMFLDALDQNKDMLYIITKANADAGGRQINLMMEEYAAHRDNIQVFDSLGMIKYLSVVKYIC